MTDVHSTWVLFRERSARPFRRCRRSSSTLFTSNSFFMIARACSQPARCLASRPFANAYAHSLLCAHHSAPDPRRSRFTDISLRAASSSSADNAAFRTPSSALKQNQHFHPLSPSMSADLTVQQTPSQCAALLADATAYLAWAAEVTRKHADSRTVN
jgi:hypothetical protein